MPKELQPRTDVPTWDSMSPGEKLSRLLDMALDVKKNILSAPLSNGQFRNFHQSTCESPFILEKGSLGSGSGGLLANASAFGQEQGSLTKGDIVMVHPLLQHRSSSKANGIRSLARLPAPPSAEMTQRLFPGFIAEDVQTSVRPSTLCAKARDRLCCYCTVTPRLT
jgi:hypothetical protein